MYILTCTFFKFFNIFLKFYVHFFSLIKVTKEHGNAQENT